MKARLNEQWVSRIFQRLTGIYGAQFRAKYSQIEAGEDVGLKMAVVSWSAELGGFEGRPDAIAWALDHLPSDHCPNALEFRDICRRAPAPDVPALPYRPTEADRERAHSAIEAAAKSLKPKLADGIDAHWASHPRSPAHLRAIGEAAERDPRFRPHLQRLVERGIVSEDGRLLQAFKGGVWQRV